MITLRSAAERYHVRRYRQDAWLTFYPRNPADPLARGFGTLEVLIEVNLPPGAALWLDSQHAAEIVTYVFEGALAQKDSMGALTIVRTGEFQRVIAKDCVRQNTTNASRSAWARVFQMWLRPTLPEVAPSREQRRFSTAERRGALCLIASPDGRKGSLRLHQGALVYSAILAPGQHLAHELTAQRVAWVHIVSGEAILQDLVLEAGDGAGVAAERAVSLTAREESELLLLDLSEQPQRFRTMEVSHDRPTS